MKQEAPYAFRTECCRVHKRICNWKKINPTSDELALTDGVTLSCAANGEVAMTALRDFRDYLKTAFGFKAQIVPEDGLVSLKLDPSMTDYMTRKVTVTDAGVQIAAADERGIAQALYYLEDELNRRQAPCLKQGTVEQKPAFSPRMTHSGIGVDLYPDEYLSACARHGFDAVLVFLREPSMPGIEKKHMISTTW